MAIFVGFPVLPSTYLGSFHQDAAGQPPVFGVSGAK